MIRLWRIEVCWNWPLTTWRAWAFGRWEPCPVGCRIVDVGPFNFTWLMGECYRVQSLGVPRETE